MKKSIENSLTLEEILSNKKYSVNYYQREYRWGKKQVEQLIEGFDAEIEAMEECNILNETIYRKVNNKL